MTDLIARLEKAMEGSRELDFEILKLAHPELEIFVEPAVPMLLEPARVMARTKPDRPATHIRVEHYTTSIDAALTLVPEGAGYHLSSRTAYRGYYAHVELADHREIDTTAATPALALTAAALKAREASR